MGVNVFRKGAITFCFLVFSQSLHAVQATIDLDSWTFPVGRVVEPSCLWSQPSSGPSSPSSLCLEWLDESSVLMPWGLATENSYIKTSISKRNALYNCVYAGRERFCTGGEPYIRIEGWVYSKYFEIQRQRKTCDYFSEMTVYLERPSIYCTDSYCEIDVNYSPSPNDIRVSAEITTYDKRDRYLGTEDEDETDFSPFGSTDLNISIDGDVQRVVLTDVSCEKW